MENKKQTLHEAVDLSIEIWEHLAKTGGGKDSLPCGLREKVKGMPHLCPLCHYGIENNGHREKCEGCPLGWCGASSLYQKWDKDPLLSNSKREAAGAIVKRLKDWKKENPLTPETPEGEIIFPPLRVGLPNCFNSKCTKRLDSKCSIWEKPSKDVCPEYKGMFTHISEAIKLVNNAMTLTIGQTAREFNDYRDAMSYATAVGSLRNGGESPKKTDLELKQERLAELKNKKGNLDRGINNLVEEIKDLEAQTEKKLFLELGIDNLIIAYGNKNNSEVVGWLHLDRQFEALSSVSMLEAYEEWYANGMKVDEGTKVKWRGRVYKLSKIGAEGQIMFSSYKNASYTDKQNIYNFTAALPSRSCNDPNVITTKGIKRVVVF